MNLVAAMPRCDLCDLLVQNPSLGAFVDDQVWTEEHKDRFQQKITEVSEGGYFTGLTPWCDPNGKFFGIFAISLFKIRLCALLCGYSCRKDVST
jgi:hypothetical protein